MDIGIQRSLLKIGAPWIGVGLIVLLLLSNMGMLKFYLLLDLNFYLALILSPFIIGVDRERKGRSVYGFMSFVFMSMWHGLGVQTFFFLALMFGIMFLVDRFIGRLNLLSFFFVFICSPLATYGFRVFGFPIRLKLTEWATDILSHVGLPVSSVGNTILYMGEEFVVESACSGLKMVITGLLICMLIMRNEERTKGKRINFFNSSLIFSIALLLIILTNLMRIICMILMKSPEATVSHETIGIVSLVLYTVLPLMYLVPRLMRKSKVSSLPKGEQRLSLASSGAVLVVVSALLCHPHRPMIGDSLSKKLDDSFFVEGFERQEADFDGYKFENDCALLYIKPCFDFWRADHNPTICWRGSGYEFSEERIQRFGEHEVFTATLRKGEDVLYTAWWYQSGENVLIDQLDWRWDMAKGGGDYDLMNVSCEEKEELAEQIVDLMSRTTHPVD